MRRMILATIVTTLTLATAAALPPPDTTGAAAPATPAGAYHITGSWPVPGGVASTYLRASDDGRYVSWSDVYTEQYRILDTLTGDVADLVTDTAALTQGGGRWVDGRLYLPCYVAPCNERSTWVVEPRDWTAKLYVDGAWLLGRVAGADVLAVDLGYTWHGYIDHPANETWQHGAYAVEYGGGRAVYTSWGYGVAEYDTSSGVSPLPITGQSRVSPAGTVCDWRGEFLRLNGAWLVNPAAEHITYVYAVSDAGVAVCDYQPVPCLGCDLRTAVVDLATGALLYDAGAYDDWQALGIAADGTVWLGDSAGVVRVSR